MIEYGRNIRNINELKMEVRVILGEVSGKDLIDIGNIVEVKYNRGKKAFGRLNEASLKHIRVGNKIIKINNITEIKKKEF